ncbi:MAG: hypothetical protein R2748_19820 [Bryobacterales bacterium]
MIDIESITPNEEKIGDWLYDYVQPTTCKARYGGRSRKIEEG